MRCQRCGLDYDSRMAQCPRCNLATNQQQAYFQWAQQNKNAQPAMPTTDTIKTKRNPLIIPLLITSILSIVFFVLWLTGQPTSTAKLSAKNSVESPNETTQSASESEEETLGTKSNGDPKVTAKDGHLIWKFSDLGITNKAGITWVFENVYDLKDDSSSYRLKKIGVYLTIKNGSDETIRVSPFDYKVKTRNGEILDKTWSSKHTEMESMKLAPGGATTGMIPFEVPVDTEGLSLLYYWNEIIDDSPTWEVMLYE